MSRPPSRYDHEYARSLAEPEAFWAEAAQAIAWDHPWDRVLDAERAPFYRWFAGARLNVCHNALDRHVAAGHGDRPALIYDSPVTGTVRTYTYAELCDLTARLAGVLAGLGVTHGDRVLIYMPMVPETVMAMLACARLGAIHSVVFGGFAANELAVRIDDARPKVIISASHGIEPGRIVPYKPLLDAAIDQASAKPAACLILQRSSPPSASASAAPAPLTPGRDHDFADLLARATPAPAVSIPATDPLYILYTSGTTGIPKGVVHDAGGYAVALAWSMKNVFDIAPGEVFWAASDLGWAVGHSYIVYAPLLHGATTVLYEGKPVGTPDAGAFWRVIRQHQVVTLFTAPTALRAIKRDDPDGVLLRAQGLGTSEPHGFRALFLAGERADPPTVAWAEERLGVPVIDNWWQTETGWPIAANCLGLGALPVKPGSATKPVPGWDLHVVDPGIPGPQGEPGAKGRERERGTIGALVIRLPMPPGALPTLWQKDQHFVASYLTEYPGYYHTSDAGYIDPDGYVYIMARTDDIINVAGHRLSTGAIEEVLASHPDVAECAVIGVHDELKEQVPVGFLVLKSNATRPPAVVASEVVRLVRERIGPVASFKQALVVPRLPKTRSGKILRSTMRSIADGQPYKLPATIDDPAVLQELTDLLSHTRSP
ncbi:MAG TPA: AMP-binding protein [Polyangia bacterium]|nr:AMP-binding protein [Polyangia bacterium]